MDFVALLRPQVCVEVGACTGSSVLPVAASLKYLGEGNIYAVDAWSNEVAIRNLTEDDPNKEWWSKVDMNDIRNTFCRRLGPYMGFCIPVFCPSEKAVDLFDAIDFLHLDGDFSEAGSLKDVELYLPRVKPGGYILISNFFIGVHGKQPKFKAFFKLFQTCETIAEIENNNAVLYRKKC